jgi:hypothetical protein
LEEHDSAGVNIGAGADPGEKRLRRENDSDKHLFLAGSIFDAD